MLPGACWMSEAAKAFDRRCMCDGFPCEVVTADESATASDVWAVVMKMRAGRAPQRRKVDG
jgi:hypothetical protein